MSLEIPISAGLANVFKFILINWGLLPVVEGTFAFLNRRWAAYAVMQGGSVYWKECRAGALYLHSKYFSRKSWFLVLLVSLVANALVFVMENGVTFGEAHKSKLGQVLRSRDPNGVAKFGCEKVFRDEMLRREGILFDNIRLTRRTDPVSELRSSPIFEPDFPKASYDESMSEARAWLKRNRGASEDVVLQFGRGLDVFYNWAINMSTAAGADGRDGQALIRQRAFFGMDYCINSNSELEVCTAVRTKEVQMEITSLKGDDFTALDASRVVKNDFSVGRKLELIQRPDFVEVGTKTYSNWDDCSSKCVHPADEGQYNATCRPKFDRSYLIENGFCFPPLEEGDTIVCLRVNEDLGGYIGIVAYLASGQDDVGSVEYNRVEPDSGSKRLI